MSKWIKQLFCLVLSINLLFSFFASPVSALTKEDINAINRGTTFYREGGDETCSLSGSSSSTSNKVFIIGDSITAQAQAEYEKVLPGVTVDGSSSRSITGAGIDGNKLSGLAAVDQDANAIKGAGKIIIALGTNGGNTAETISQMVDKIKTLQASASIYWVDATVIGRPDYVATINAANGAIYAAAPVKNFTVIPWAETVTPGVNPQALSGSETDPGGYIRQSDQFVHPTPAGITALVRLVSTKIGAGTGGSGGSCCSSASLLSGGDNKSRIYNYFIKNGLTPVQAAGIMGNLQAESGFNPKRVQGTPTPSGDGDVMKIDDKTGYGIAQWTTRSRQQALHDAAVAAGVPDSDLGVQLDYLWGELGGLLDQIKALNDVSAVTSLFMLKFERPFDQSQAAQAERAALSIDILANLGSGAGTAGSTGSSSTTSGSSGCSTAVGDFAKYANMTREQLADLILNSPNLVLGNYGNAVTQRTDIQNIETLTLLRGLAALLEQSGAKILVNALKTDHKPGSLHEFGRAIDIGYWGNGQPNHNDDGDKLFKFIYDNRDALGVQELIWKYPPVNYICIGVNGPTDCVGYYTQTVFDQHDNHIHLGVKADGQ